MSRTLQFKRYANTTVANTTGADGELIIDANARTITIHDGITPGGKRIATESYAVNVLLNFNTSVNSAIAYAQSSYAQANTANALAANAYTLANSTNLITSFNSTQINQLFAASNTVPSSFYGTNLSVARTFNSTLYFNSNNGIQIIGSGNNIFFNNPQNLQTNATPTFATITSNNFYTNTSVDLYSFANAAYNQSNTSSILAQNAYTRANGAPNLFSGTSNFATAPLGTLYFNSNNGIQIVGSGNALYFNNPQNLQTNGTPVFANVTSNNFYTNTSVDLFTFANAAYTQANSANVLAQSAFNTANNAANGRAQNAESGNYVLQLSDAGKYIYYTQSSNVILYIPTSANVAFTNGTTIMVVSQNTAVSSNITVYPNTGVSLYNAGNTISGSHNVTPYGVATLMMVKANTWFISGFGVN
jgi:hypothetical protein